VDTLAQTMEAGSGRRDSGYGAELQPMLGSTQKESAGQRMFLQVMKKFGGLWKLFFFSAGLATITAAVISIIGCAFQGQPVFLFFTQIYLVLIGSALCILDLPDFRPGNEPTHFYKIHFAVNKYLMGFTRFIGRGIAFLFLATMIYSALWNNNVFPSLGIIFGGYVAFVGIVSIAAGLRRSYVLDRTRVSLQRQVATKGESYISMICPRQGITGEQFKELALQFNGEKFSDEDIRYIMHALCNGVKRSPYPVASYEDFSGWVMGRYMTLM